MNDLRKARCKGAAHKLLKDVMVESPDEIDLVTIAHKAGRLRIEDGGLEHAEGRIVVPSAEGGTIRVKAGMHPGRRRFTIAHEIGHYILHPREGLDRSDTAANFTVWKDASEEAEANLFAAELLMPDFLFEPKCRKTVPALALIDRLAAEFSTSMLATAYQYVSFTNEQIALVVSEGDRIKWFHRSKDFWPMIRTGNLSPDSAAGERAAGKAGDTKKMVRSPAYGWLKEFENDNRRDVMEDSRYLDWYDRTLTLLWLEDDLDE